MKIIKYGADWCGPCRTAKQLLINSGVDFTEVDVDENRFIRYEDFVRKMMSR